MHAGTYITETPAYIPTDGVADWVKYTAREEKVSNPTAKSGLDNKQLNPHESEVLNMFKKKYKLNLVKDVPIDDILAQLIIRVDIIPEQLILVQAANESGWGTSRFAVNGYNFFGLWCFRQGCGFVPRDRNDDAEHEVARFRDLSHCVMTYILSCLLSEQVVSH